MEYALALVLLVAAVVFVVSRPLRTVASAERLHADQLRELEAAKEAKYREIRDADLDRRTGKLAEADWRRIDRELRAEAVEILGQIDRLA